MASVLGPVGRLRRRSLNREPIRVAATSAPSGISVVRSNGLRPLPPSDEDIEGEAAPSTDGAVWVRDEVSKVVTAMGADVLTEGLAVPRPHTRLAAGTSRDPSLPGGPAPLLDTLTGRVGVPA